MSESGNFGSRILKKLFSKSEKREPLVSGPLSRDERFKANFERWLASDEKEKILLDLQLAYQNSNAFDQYNPAFHMYHSRQSNGFFFNEQVPFESDSFAFLLDYFKDVVLSLGYTVYTSDRKYKDLNSGVQRIDRHYLKPLSDSTKPPIDQKFGNVLIELFFLDDEVQYLKLMVNVYSDRSFTEALGFDEFMEVLFGI